MAQDLIHHYEDAKEVAKAVVEDFIQYTNRIISETGSCVVAISGGKTPNEMFSLMNEEENMKRIDWKNLFFLWVDERFISQDNPDNNYYRAKKLLFDNLVGISHYYPIPTDKGTVEVAASYYEEEVKNVLDACGKEKLDLVLLGLGDDGHTASLFPRSQALLEKQHWVVGVTDGKVWDRITMTFPFLAKATSVWFTVVGESKAIALHKVLQQRELYESDTWERRINHTLPGAVLSQDPIHWYVDRDGASKL